MIDDNISGQLEYLAYLEAAVTAAGFKVVHDGGTLGDSNFRLVPIADTKPAAAQEAVYEISHVSPMNFGGFCAQIITPTKLERGTKLYAAHVAAAPVIDPSWSLHDRVEFALRDAGFDLDEAAFVAEAASVAKGDLDSPKGGSEVVSDAMVEVAAKAMFYANTPENMIKSDWDSGAILGPNNEHRNNLIRMAKAALGAVMKVGSTKKSQASDAEVRDGE